MKSLIKSKYKNNANFSAAIPTDKLFFSIGEVADILDINTSTIHFWDKEFDFNFQKNSRNERRFRREDIEDLQIIIYLKSKGLNLAGIKTELKNNKIEEKQRLQSIKSLQNIKRFLIMLRDEFRDVNDIENYSFEEFELKFGEKKTENADLNIQSSSNKDYQDDNHSESYNENLVDNDDEQMYSPEYLEEYHRNLVEGNGE